MCNSQSSRTLLMNVIIKNAHYDCEKNHASIRFGWKFVESMEAIVQTANNKTGCKIREKEKA